MARRLWSCDAASMAIAVLVITRTGSAPAAAKLSQTHPNLIGREGAAVRVRCAAILSSTLSMYMRPALDPGRERSTCAFLPKAYFPCVGHPAVSYTHLT